MGLVYRITKKILIEYTLLMLTTSLISAPQSTSTLLNYVNTEPISSKDIFELVQSVAALNLGYLTIAVAIIALLGGAFIYFNINPLKELLSKQEDRLRKTEDVLKERFEKIEDDQRSTFDNLFLKLETKSTQLAKQIKNTHATIKQEVSESLDDFEKTNNKLLEDTQERFSLETTNKIEILKQESENKRLETEARVAEKVSKLEKDLMVEIGSIRKDISTMKDQLNKFMISIKELEMEEFKRKNQQGFIIRNIELLELAIEQNGWNITERLQTIKEYLGEYPVSAYVNDKLLKALSKIEDRVEHKDLILNIKNLITLKKD